MGKSRCVLTLPLEVEKWQKDKINQRMEVCRKMYNALCGFELKKYHRLQENKEYYDVTTQLYQLAKEGKKGSKEYKAAGKRRSELIREFGFSEYAFIADIKPFHEPYKTLVGSTMVRSSVCSPLWKAFEKLFFGNGKKVHFKKYGTLNSMTCDGKSGIRVVNGEGKNIVNLNGDVSGQLYVLLGIVGGRTLKMPIHVEPGNLYESEMLTYPVKLVSIVRDKVKGHFRYSVQLCLEGLPAVKYDRETGEVKHPTGQGRVALSINTKELYIKTENQIDKVFLSDGVADFQTKIAELRQRMDHSRRVMNPENYNTDGTVKKGLTVNGKKQKLHWIYSKNYFRMKNRIATLLRKERISRKQRNCWLANNILSLGDEFVVNDYNYAAAARRKTEDEFNENGTQKSKRKAGSNILSNAPSALITTLNAKAVSRGLREVVKVDLKGESDFEENKYDAGYWTERLYSYAG